MTLEQTMATIATAVGIGTLILGFGIVIWKGGQWAGAAKQRSYDFQQSLKLMAEHYDEEIDRIQENTNSIDSQVNGRIDRHLEGHPTR